MPYLQIIIYFIIFIVCFLFCFFSVFFLPVRLYCCILFQILISYYEEQKFFIVANQNLK